MNSRVFILLLLTEIIFLYLKKYLNKEKTAYFCIYRIINMHIYNLFCMFMLDKK